LVAIDRLVPWVRGRCPRRAGVLGLKNKLTGILLLRRLYQGTHSVGVARLPGAVIEAGAYQAAVAAWRNGVLATGVITAGEFHAADGIGTAIYRERDGRGCARSGRHARRRNRDPRI